MSNCGKSPPEEAKLIPFNCDFIRHSKDNLRRASTFALWNFNPFLDTLVIQQDQVYTYQTFPPRPIAPDVGTSNRLWRSSLCITASARPIPSPLVNDTMPAAVLLRIGVRFFGHVSIRKIRPTPSRRPHGPNCQSCTGAGNLSHTTSCIPSRAQHGLDI